MEKLLKALGVHRSSFLRIYEDTVRLMQTSDWDMDDIQGNVRILDQKMKVIQNLNEQILDLMLDSSDISEEDLEAEVYRADDLLGKYNRLKSKFDKMLNKDSLSDISNRSSLSQVKRNLKLPQLEMKKFNGEVREWLPFWAQFERIHKDESIDNEDKFYYLISSTVPKSRARLLVESYPQTSENYPKAIEALKSRFGREDLLIEVYVRELLKLVLNNLNTKVKLSSLYDQLESQLRSLETLGVNTDKCAAMLYPLVESCLPEDILRVWQRSNNYDLKQSLKSRLETLMEFLRKEVEGEERISLAMAGFGLPCKKKDEVPLKITPVSTASGLMSQNITPKCVFCSKLHRSTECEEVSTKKLSYDEKCKILLEKGRCYLCLKFGHRARKCKVNVVCSNCKGKHVTLMCQKIKCLSTNTISNANTTTENSISVDNLSNTTCDKTFLQTLLVKLCGNGSTRLVRAIIDTGSQRSYVTKQAAMEMGYEVLNSEQIVHALFGGEHSEVVHHKCYRVTLQNMEDTYKCNFSALDQELICKSVIFIHEGYWKQELEEAGIVVTDTHAGPIEILIGADIAGKLFTGKRYVLPCGLVAMETKLGWTLMGKVSDSTRDISRSSSMIISSMLCSDDITYLWNLDVLGISDPGERKIKKDGEKEIMKKFSESVQINAEGRYEVGLTWIEGHPPLPNNFGSAKKRLDNLMKKLDIDGYYSMYDEVFHDWKQEGIIENMPNDSTSVDGYYLPHRHVVKLSSATTKLRPVFDASAKERNQPSLNQCLDKGINLIELIPSILIRFRTHKIGVISDIRKAFLQISLKKEDRQFLRFIWYDKRGELQFFQHTRVVFGVTCSPYLLAAVINHHLEKFLNMAEGKYSKNVLLKLMNGFYIDNCVTSLENEEQLHQFIKESSDIMMEGKFDLRGWEYTMSEQENGLEDRVLCPVLGLIWNRKTDTLAVNFDWLETINAEIITKRSILSIAHRLFDPIGFSCPVQIGPRILLQRTWVLKIKWDEEVSLEIKTEFLRWLNEVQYLRDLRVPRWLMKSYSDCWSIHMFCDASKDAYAAVIFLRTESIGDVHIQLIQARNRISPVKKLTIPRLELLAATIGARLLTTVMEDIDKPDLKVYCWTDSTTVLSWIRREDLWKPFIWNRIQEIRSLTRKQCWFHVPGHMNPADLPSRGCTPKQLLLTRWWEGPSWLKEEKDWPEQNIETNEEEILEERRKEVSIGFLNVEKDFTVFYQYFSKYNKNLKQIAWIKRFISNCQHVKAKKVGSLSVEEIEDAEITLLKLVQEESFKGIEDNSISSLCPFFDNKGVMRIKTKITQRNDMQDFLYPILLPSKHFVTEKLILYYHLNACHVGIQGLLCRIRERFWILSGRRTIRRVISKCIICKKFEAKKMNSGPVELPVDRVRDAAVFEIVGVDLAGPLFLKSKEKVWICLFTCAVYRAVHLEIVCSLSTETFLLAFRRFIARRGRPATVYSDNGTNFVGAENCFRNVDWTKVHESSSIDRIKWKFNPPGAAWWGGWWERLIRILKNLLRRQLGKACLSYEEMYTALCDCEAVINSRPLTYITENSQDLIPLTPTMFLQEIRENGTPDLDALDATSLRRHARYLFNIRLSLRKRFRAEYLSQLILFGFKGNSTQYKVGDVVVIESDNLKRLDWPLGIIEEVFPGKDGKIRLVQLRTSKGKLLRPIQRLYPLEINSNSDSLELKNKFVNIATTQTNQREISFKPIISEDVNVVETRAGRRVRAPCRLGY